MCYYYNILNKIENVLCVFERYAYSINKYISYKNSNNIEIKPHHIYMLEYNFLVFLIIRFLIANDLVLNLTAFV